MATLAQIEAARRNGAKSKGPVTAEGKQRSSRNAATHGLTGKRLVVLSNENDEAFLAFVAEFEKKLKPVDEIERGFVLQAAAARWRLRRAWAIETGLMDIQMDEKEGYMRKVFGDFDETAHQAVAFRSLVAQTRALDVISRYETRLSREYDRAIKGLERIRAERDAESTPAPEPEIQNEPKPDTATLTSERNGAKGTVTGSPSTGMQTLPPQNVQNEPSTPLNFRPAIGRFPQPTDTPEFGHPLFPHPA